MSDHESHHGTFTIIECKGCGLFATSPAPTASTIHHLYDNRVSTDFNPADSTTAEVLKDWLSRRELQRLTTMLQDLPVAKVLDFGCGDGRSVRNLARLLPLAEVHGTDFSEEPPPLLHAAEGKCARTSYLPYREHLTSTEQYDLILVRHVLEHNVDPVSFLEELSVRLSPTGVIWIEVPSVSSVWRRLLGQYWHLWYVPRHLFHFAPRTLRDTCTAAGLEVVALRRIDMPLIGRSLRNRLGVRYSLPLLLFGAITYSVQVGVDRLFGSSSCIQALCRRAENAMDGGE